MEQLRVDATRLARSFANAPRLEVFAHARALRDRVFTLLDGRQRLGESRDLYFLAGAACGMLAEITENFGYRQEAMAHTRTAFLCAQEAGHAGLMAWIRGEQSLIAYYGGRPAQAVEYARRGREEHAPTGTVGVWLSAMEARASANLGNASATLTALGQAERSRERCTATDLDELGGLLTFGEPRQRLYSADAQLAIEAADAVVAEAEACLTGYRDGPAEQRAYDNEAQAQVTLASAHVLAGDLDAAREAAQPAFAIRPELRIDTLDQRLRDLHGRLTDQGVRDAPVAVELRDQIETFLATDPTALPGA
jgi:tetratricopeptide (TPR) repeat protein